ncbi:hypothetical protein [Propionicimonas sp.]|uniref:hypothetical protein n=1 Tax=Propionicimonas sp. TaxID=1955623 RepID=UPI0017D814D3|nr:hypothetical protein [Propionicimonas sp.]MBU3976578.1 hypothetical protein [Actinomycetota bacterium]MBA3020422.1 hypothetical protein [Propionicimonas sp.]MBU3986595.1 hypothetical protein [Actinomycetota bacterium]MBU4007253.1 hypothetical protein [Actinomycetota bacterium]MBU4065006.1 hypothetical protein [Actinomycetota bacterium]
MRKLAALLVATAMAGAAAISAAAPAQAAAVWADGSIQETWIANCVNGNAENGVGAYVGYLADPDNGSPSPGETYWIHIYAAGLGNPCAGQRVLPELVLPPHTRIATDSTHKITCFGNGVADSGCPQTLSPGINSGSLRIPSSDTARGGLWPLPQGGTWEWQIPVVTDRPLTMSLFGAYLIVADGFGNPTLPLGQDVYVFSKSLKTTYPNPSTTGITSNAAVSKANIYTDGLAGTGYFDLGTNTSYGLFSDPVAIPEGGPNWQPYTDWKSANGTSNLKPGTTYHWRFRFVTSGGATYTGADQSFTTASSGSGGNPGTPTPPATPPTAKIAGQPALRTGLSVPVSWSGTAGSAKVANYDVRYRRAAWNGSYGAWQTWKSKTTARTAKLTAKAGSSYCFASRSRDAKGQVSAWTAETCTSTPTDDRKLTRAGTWKKVKSTKSFAKTVLTAKKAGIKLTAKKARVHRLALLVTTGPGYGSVTVRVGSRVLGTYSLASAKVKKQVRIDLPTLPTSTTGDVVITTNSNKLVTIDGLLMSRQ